MEVAAVSARRARVVAAGSRAGASAPHWVAAVTKRDIKPENVDQIRRQRDSLRRLAYQWIERAREGWWLQAEDMHAELAAVLDKIAGEYR